MNIISTLVRCDNQYRIFQTNSFSIRALVIILTRYSPNAEILRIKYGDFQCPCPKWTEDYEPCSEENCLPIAHKYTKADLLRTFDYRTAINIHYYQCFVDGKYPSKNPFKGVKCWLESDYDTIQWHPFFMMENDCGPNILCLYEGKYINRYLNGEKVKGYYCTSPRIIDLQPFDNE